jgi:DNA mismatch endonuclease (patch repair protein)
MDRLSPERRSANMRAIRQKDTKPELLVRSLLFGAGYRYRLHGRALPGSPDLVFPARRKVVFVHGCFWHRHEGCRKAYTPKTRQDFWVRKFIANQERDGRALSALTSAGWDAFVVWECEAVDAELLRQRLTTFLGPPKVNRSKHD